jgi:hypothetical protein
MTRKDYEAIAAALMEARFLSGQRTEGAQAVNDAAVLICDVMAADNPRFDRARFLKACGVQS